MSKNDLKSLKELRAQLEKQLADVDKQIRSIEAAELRAKAAFAREQARLRDQEKVNTPRAQAYHQKTAELKAKARMHESRARGATNPEMKAKYTRWAKAAKSKAASRTSAKAAAKYGKFSTYTGGKTEKVVGQTFTKIYGGKKATKMSDAERKERGLPPKPAEKTLEQRKQEIEAATPKGDPGDGTMEEFERFRRDVPEKGSNKLESAYQTVKAQGLDVQKDLPGSTNPTKEGGSMTIRTISEGGLGRSEHDETMFKAVVGVTAGYDGALADPVAVELHDHLAKDEDDDGDIDGTDVGDERTAEEDNVLKSIIDMWAEEIDAVDEEESDKEDAEVGLLAKALSNAGLYKNRDAVKDLIEDIKSAQAAYPNVSAGDAYFLGLADQD